MKRNTVAKQTTITYRDLTIEKENRVVRRGSDVIELTKREYELLLTLMENVNVVLARDVLLNKVWGYETEVETNVVDVYIRYLRNKIDVPGEESYIQTVRGSRIRDAFVELKKKNEKTKRTEGAFFDCEVGLRKFFLYICCFYNFCSHHLQNVYQPACG